MTTPPAPVTEEIRAFQQGFGSPPALARALRQTRFLVAVDADGIAVSFRYPVGGEPGPRWVCAFTTPELAESFAERHGAGPGGSAGWRWLVRAGAELLDTLLPQFTERTGLFVDRDIDANSLDYPRTGLEATPFSAGWSVFAPFVPDPNDPMSFLDTPVGRAVFYIGYDGRIEKYSSSLSPTECERLFLEGGGTN